MNGNTTKRYAVISDVHGNYKALEAFLEYCSTHPVDGIIGLGDYMTDSPYPERTIALLKQMREQYRCYMIRGNRENYLLDNLRNDRGWKPSSASGCFYYTAGRLSQVDMEFLGNMPEEMKVIIKGCPELYICHGIPGNVRGNVDYNPELKEISLSNLKGKYLLGGHSHIQEIYEHGGKTYLNPGSLGLALDGIGRHAQFAIIYGDPDEWKIELCSIPYDADSFLKDFTESGLDELGFVLNRAVKKTVTTGINYVINCVTAAEKEAGMPPDLIPEEVWDKVALKLGI
ncbi:MAG: metallophosphoesterase family protein [Lachnospiraceae bacterium]|nr:metallophosphoesterase family protein [Lachnospiraceae bacterium]